MPDPRSNQMDIWLERLSKLAGILLPLTIFFVGSAYTRQKDISDAAMREAQQTHDAEQKDFDNTQKRYSNLTALLPFLTSEKEQQVRIGLEVYLSEAGVFQAPTDLQATVARLQKQFPNDTLLQQAAEAGKRQQVAECKANEAGIYLQVANDRDQFDRGKALAARLTAAGVSPPVQGVQRIDQGPSTTQLRYYFSQSNTAQAERITEKIKALGINKIDRSDLTRYLKSGCQPPAVYELWIGTSSPLS